MSKRIIALSLILAIMFSFACVAPASAAIEHEEQLYIDLGILPPKKTTGLIKPTLNREQLAEILVNMQGMEGLSDGEDLATDIERSSRRAAINYCIANNYLTVDEEGAFRPSGSITYSDAIRAMITLLGYDVIVQNKADDNEFFAVAAKLGIVRGVVVPDSSKMGYDEMYTLICRSMKVNLPINEYISEDSLETLYDRLKVEEKSGKLLANSRHSAGVDRPDKGEVNIDGTVYRTQLDIANELVGAEVIYYLRDDEVVSLSPKTKLEYLTLTPYDIESVKDNGSEIVLTCNGEEETVRIKKSAVAIVNNKTMAPTKKLFESFTDGSMTLVETKGGGYGVIHMDIVKTVTVSSTSELSYSIRAKYTDELIKLQKAERNLEIYKNGKSAEFSDIKEDSVVSVICDAYSFDGNGDIVYNYNNITWAKIYISDIKISGLVDGMEDENIFIDDMDYKTAYSFSSLVAKKQKEAVRLGDFVNVKLDYLGYIADVEVDKENGGYNYGYLIKAAVGGGLSKELQFKIMDTKGDIGIYSAAEKLIVDGVAFKTAALTYDVGAAEDVDLTKRQVIAFRLADDGSVRSIDTEIRSSAESEFSLNESLPFDPYALAQPLSRVRSSVVSKKMAIANDCIVFVDSAGLGMTFPDDHYFSIRKPSAVSGSQRYYMALYDADEMGSAKCGVIWEQYHPEKLLETAADSKTGLSYNTYSYMVENVKTAIEDGEEYYKLSLADYNNKVKYDTVLADYLEFYTVAPSDAFPSSVVNSWVHEKVYKDNPDLYPEGGGRPGGEAPIVFRKDGLSLGTTLKAGDIVRITLNNEGKIKYLERIFDFNESKDTVFASTGNSGTHILFANLEKTSDGLIMYENPSVSGEYQIFNTLARPAVVVMDLQTGEITLEKNYSMVPSNSVGDNVKVLLRDYDGGTVMEYFVYRY